MTPAVSTTQSIAYVHMLDCTSPLITPMAAMCKQLRMTIRSHIWMWIQPWML